MSIIPASFFFSIFDVLNKYNTRLLYFLFIFILAHKLENYTITDRITTMTTDNERLKKTRLELLIQKYFLISIFFLLILDPL